MKGNTKNSKKCEIYQKAIKNILNLSSLFAFSVKFVSGPFTPFFLFLFSVIQRLLCALSDKIGPDGYALAGRAYFKNQNEIEQKKNRLWGHEDGLESKNCTSTIFGLKENGG